MAYRADIEIAVKGAKQLAELRKQLEDTSKSIGKVNAELKSQNLIAQSVNSLNKTVTRSAQAMRSAAAGTTAQKQAIDVYVKSVYAAEKAEKDLQRAIQARRRELGLATKASEKAASTQSTLIKQLSGRLSSATIGGAFPLLFGQSPQAAVGGAIGGLLGGQAGGFAGSLLGTALGELSAAKARVEELGTQLGFTTAQTAELAKAFDLAGKNSEQLENAIINIQGIGLSTQETASALKISNELAEEYGGKVDKIAQAFANTLESGKVSITTLNAFTAQGIPIQDKLAEKLGVTKNTLLDMAKSGKVSVQEVINVLVDMGKEAESTASRARTGFENFTSAVKNLAVAIADNAGVILKTLVPALNVVLNRLALIIQQATTALSKLSDVTFGQLYKSTQASGTFRGSGFGSKSNIDAITNALKNLNPAVAQNSEDIANYRKAIATASTELSKYNGVLGEYAEKTAQVEISRLQQAVNARELALPKEPVTTTPAITGITAPVQLPPSAGTGAASARREAERVTKALINQRAITLEIQRQSEFSAKIAAAELVKDETLARRLQGEQKLVELGIQTAKELELEKDSSVQLAIAKKAQAQADLIRQETAQDIAQIENRRQEEFRKTLENLEYQLEYEGATTREKRNQLELEEAIRKAKDQGFTPEQQTQIANATRRLQEQQRPLQQYMLQLQKSLNDTESKVVSLTQTIETQLGSAMSNAIVGLVTGAERVEEVLSQMFANIGKAFIDMATQIIAQQVVMITLQTILKALGVATGGGGGGGGAPEPVNIGDSYKNFVGYASGGYVTKPTNALIGEGGEPEYVIPASKMSGAMARYSSGQRGSSVVNGAATAGGGGSQVIRFESTVINNVEYVTRSQAEAMSRQAAKQGAAGGYAKTMGGLRNSRATRARVGMG